MDEKLPKFNKGSRKTQEVFEGNMKENEQQKKKQKQK